MSTCFFVSLPYLYTVSSSKRYKNVFNLCPGLPLNENSGYLQINWPLSEELSSALLKEMRNLSTTELENYINLISYQNNASEIKFQDEMHSLKKFATGNPADDKKKKHLLLEQAQKILLWWWRKEQLQEEIAILSQQYLAQSIKLANILDNAGDDSYSFAPDSSAMSWEICLFNALFFLPDSIGIFAEGAMAEDISQSLEFKPASDNIPESKNAGDKFLCAQACAAELFHNKSIPKHLSGEILSGLNKRRRWIIADR